MRAAVGVVAVAALLFGGSASAEPVGPLGREEAFEDVERFKEATKFRGEWSLSSWTPVHRHSGFYLRPDLGVGYLSTSAGSGAGELGASGAAGFFGLHVGGAVAENLMLAAHLFTGAVPDPEITVGDRSSGTLPGATGSVVGIGPELTYYFMPANAYVSATVAVTRLSLALDGDRETSEAGVGGRLGIGKEWWVSQHWGLGLVGHVTGSSNEFEDLPASRFTTWGFGISFSATYN